MACCILERFKIKHIRCLCRTRRAFYVFGPIILVCAVALWTWLKFGDIWASLAWLFGGLGCLSVALALLAVAFCGMPFLAYTFPKSCGRRRWTFTKTCSLDLKSILLLIENGLPSTEDIQNYNALIIPFLDGVKGLLEDFTTCSYSYFFTGSSEERFGIVSHTRSSIPHGKFFFQSLNSDFDIMFCCQDYTASFTRCGNVHIELPQIDGKPLFGYAELRFSNQDSEEEMLDSCEFKKTVFRALDNSYLSNLQIINFCHICSDIYLNVVLTAKGTSAKILVQYCRTADIDFNEIRLYEGDITVCLRSPEWPPLSDWPNRSRCWPNDEDVQRIVSQGFHLVAKPLQHKHKMLPTWRYSFSAAEVELSKLVPDTARKCFMALKVIFKDHLKPILPELSTYHIKTVFLNTLEKHPAEFWIEENIETCFHTLLIELHTVFDTVYCGHYWLRGLINLFEEFETENHDRLKILADKVMEITNDPAPYIYDDGHYFSCTSCLCLKRSPQQHRSCTSRQCLLVTNSEIDGETQV